MLAEKIGRKSEEELRNNRITVQVSKREKELINTIAKEHGMTTSDYIRYYCIYKKFDDIFQRGGE